MRVVIIGAGLAGLGAAHYLHKKNHQVLIFEKESRAGGLCRTEREGEFLFDYTGHLLHFNDTVFRDLVVSRLKDNLIQKTRSAWIFSNNVYTKYPFQANLYGLPVDKVVECLFEFSKQFFIEKKMPVVNYNDWINQNFGEGIGKHFMVPYNRKIYKRHPLDLHPDCNGRFVPKSDLKKLLRGALTQESEDLGYNATFFYPQNDGIEVLVKSLAKDFPINLNQKVEQINLHNSTITTHNGQSTGFDGIISTQPLPLLINSLHGDNIEREKELTKKLKYVSIYNVNIGFKGDVGCKHWVYIPEERYPFHRIGFTHNFSAAMAPNGYSSVYLEISYDPLIGINKNQTIEKCIDGCIELGLIQNRADIGVINTIDIPYGYVVFDQEKQVVVDELLKSLESRKIFSAGRYGSWVYSSMEDAFMDGYTKAEKMINSANG